MTDLDAGSICLLRKFPDAVHIAQSTQRIGAAAGNEIGFVAVLCQFFGNDVHFGIDIVVAVGVHETDIGTIDVIQDQIALVIGNTPLLQNENALHTKARRAGGGQHGVVGLGSACGEDRVAALSLCLGQQILQLSDLVAAESNTAQVIPLDPDIFAVLGADVLQPVERGGVYAQRQSG